MKIDTPNSDCYLNKNDIYINTPYAYFSNKLKFF